MSKNKFSKIPSLKQQNIVDALIRKSHYDLTPVWSFKFLDLDHPQWGYHAQDIKTRNSIVDHLRKREGQTWKDIHQELGMHNTKSHYIPVSDLIKEAQDRLRYLNINSALFADEIFSLRLTGAGRLWGQIDDLNGAFYIIWYDPEHEIYPVKKSYT
jgi:hypothetical protein